MTTLTRAKQTTRYAILFLAAAVLGIAFILVIKNVISQIGQPGGDLGQQIAADVSYGQLEAPKLPSLGVAANSVSLSLDLVNGNFPQSSPTARVYKVATPALSLSAQDRARTKATNLGFTGEPTQPNTETFSWQESGKTLTLNLRNQTFDLTTNLTTVTMAGRQSFDRSGTIISRRTAQYLQNQLPLTDINYGTPIIRFVNPSASGFMPQPENATIPTSYAQVTFRRSTLNELPLYTNQGKLGPVTAIVIPARQATSSTNNQTRIDQDQLINLHNSYLPIDKTQSAIYPIINGATAYELLKSNVTGFLTSVEPVNSSIKPTTLSTARVLFATLAYLEPDSFNPTYVQPVWLFEGRGTTNVGEAQWTAMVPAIDAQRTSRLLQ